MTWHEVHRHVHMAVFPDAGHITESNLDSFVRRARCLEHKS